MIVIGGRPSRPISSARPLKFSSSMLFNSPLMFYIVCGVFSLLALSTQAVQIPDAKSLSALSADLDRRLSSFLSDSSSYDVIEQSYKNEADKSFTYNQHNGAQLVRMTANSLGDIFAKKITALREAAKFAEDLTAKYSWNSEAKVGNHVFAKEINETDQEQYQFVEQFNSLVNFDNSSVHIPIDIYSKDMKILHTLSWTSEMDQIWRRNREQDNTLSWQYFGSQTGVMRTYPATKWKIEEEPDLYDVRRRPWYTQGASSPKEMLILIDTSGSCHGQALALMKHSIVSIVDTLSENDFVNVANFSDRASVVGCFQTFVQATPRNKKKLIQFVQTLSANGVANYTSGFEFAFQQFHQFNRSNKTEGEGANCNQVIMFLTDGGTERPEELFKKYNEDKKIRIFSYAVGPIANPKAAVKWIGCYSRGFFYEIPAMGAIRSTVQQPISCLTGYAAKYVLWDAVYVDVDPDYGNLLDKADETVPVRWSTTFEDILDYLVYLATPQAVDYGLHTWTSVFLDKLGLGLVTSATLPIFNRSQEVGNQTLVGVVGIDIPISELTSAIPRNQLGEDGYAFIINSNGNIVYHPRLKTEGEYAQPPSLDFVELEEETPERLQVRKEMIDQITNHAIISEYVTEVDDHHTDFKTRHYYYTGIPHSNFSLAIVLPETSVHYIESRTTKNIADGVEQLRNSKSAVIAKFSDYCGDVSPISNVSSPFEDFVEFLQYNASLCDEEKLQLLLFDLQSSLPIDDTWENREPHLRDNGIIATMIEGQSRALRLFPQNMSEHFKIESTQWKEQLFRRTQESDNWLLTSAAISSLHNLTAGSVVVASKAVSATEPSSINLAVAGVVFTQTSLRNLITETVGVCSKAEVDCYLVDDGGFVVFHNDIDRAAKTVGKFFGVAEVESELMLELVNNSVFMQRSTYDFQGTCYGAKPSTTSSGLRLIPFYLYDLLTFNWWTATSTWTYASFMSLYTWLSATTSPVYGEEQVSTDVKETKAVAGRACIRQLHEYHFTADAGLITGIVQCTADCSRTYAASRLASHNLLLVIVDSSDICGAACDTSSSASLPYQPMETEDPFFSVDRCDVKVRYRRRPPCFEDQPSEHDSHCGACSSTVSSRRLLIVAVLLSVASVSTRRSLTWS